MNESPILDDLILKIEKDPTGSGGYQVQLEHSPAGATHPVPLEFPFRNYDPEVFYRNLDRVTWERSQGGSTGPRDAKIQVQGDDGQGYLEPDILGRKIFETLTGEVRETFITSLNLIQARHNHSMRIRLKFDPYLDGPICSLPWELLCRFETRDFFSRDIRTPIVRHVNVQRPRLNPRPLSKLRVLVVLSNPKDAGALNVEAEKERISEALGGRRDIQLRFLERPTLRKLRQKVRQEPFDILHFIGHGGFSRKGEGVLLFENDRQEKISVTGAVLADHLKGFEQIRLVFLNACETAALPRTGQGRDPYQGVAYALIMAGVPAIIAMQFPMLDQDAIDFSSAFYSFLAQGDSLENAMTEARLDLYGANAESWAWATPVLFLGVPHGKIFEAAPRDDTGPEEKLNRVKESLQSSSSKARESAQHGGEAQTEAERKIENALEFLDYERFDEALEALEAAAQIYRKDASIPYYQGLARLAGRRPRSIAPDIIRKVEKDLWKASQIAGHDKPAHVYYLQALIKYDFYRMNGLRVKQPSVDELLIEATYADVVPEEMERLLTLVPTPPNQVRDAMEKTVGKSL